MPSGFIKALKLYTGKPKVPNGCDKDLKVLIVRHKVVLKRNKCFKLHFV